MTAKRKVILAIDTSNYTTSAACSTPDRGHVSGGFLIKQEKQLLTVRAGERGLRQSDALFAHTCNLPPLMERILSTLTDEDEIVAVGCSTTPRRQEGSYMPCFLAGENVARGIAASLRVPYYTFSHQEGHIAAAAYSAVTTENGAQDDSLSTSPFLAFHVSGGTTDLLHVSPSDNRYEIEMLGTSLDLHAGQAIDRVGVMLGLSFPCGPALESLAKTYTEKIPSPKICVRGCDCNLSGLENLAQKMHREGASDSAIAAFVFAFLEKTLIKMTENALSLYPNHPVLYAGGVMSNKLMRTSLSKFCKTNGSRAYFAEPAFSADNAVGTSLLACRAYLADQILS